MSDTGDNKKLTRREKKQQKQLERMAENDTDVEIDDLQQFALSQATTNTNIQQDNAIDIKIEKFDLSAAGKELFRNASLKITNGRKYGLVGPNGHGKTTLLRHIVTRKLQIPMNIDVLLCEQDVIADETIALDVVLKADVKMMSILSQVEKLKIEAEAGGEGDENVCTDEAIEKLNKGYDELNAMGSNKAESKARRILSGLGFTEKMMMKATKDFSGGWRMRVSLARALFMEPTLLLLDEPTNHLDLNAVIWLDNYLQRWKKTILIVSHDQMFLDNVCTDIIHLNQKQLKYYTGNYTKFREMFQQDLVQERKKYEQWEKDVKANKKKGSSKKDAEKKVRDTALKKQIKTKKNKPEEIDEMEPINILEKPKEYQVKFDFPNPTKLTGSILGLSGVSFQYPGTKNPIFENLDFGVDMNSRVSIVGPNGVGKSTFLKLLVGELEPTVGERTINHRVKLGKYNQHSGDQLNMKETPVEYLQRLFNLSYQEARQNLGRFGLESSAHTVVNGSLSGGQKARVAFAELALTKPDLLILDEPTNNLDLESIEALCLAIRQFTGGLVVVTHDERLIRETQCDLWVVENRHIAEVDGDFDDYRKEVLEALNEEISNPSAVAAAAGVMD